jgi:putative peptidoglycan lipid II flippase
MASGITGAAGEVINGPVSWLGYAFRFLQLPLGVFGVAIATAALPAVSRSAAGERLEEFRDTVAHSLGMLLLLTVPASVGLAVLGESMIGAVYQGGRFQAFDTHQTAMALTCYSVGLLGYAAIKVLAPAFCALNDARTPMWISAGSIAANIAAAKALLRWSGLSHAALALATSLVALVGAAGLFVMLGQRINGIHGRRLAATAVKVSLAAAMMGIVCRASSAAIHAAAGAGRFGHIIDVTVSIPLGAAIFYFAANRLQVEELEAVLSACYTSIRNAPRPEVGDPPARNR